MEGNDVGSAKSAEQKKWDKALDDWWWLDKFNLPPQVVDEIPLESFNRIPLVDNEAVRVRNEAQERANRGSR